MNYTDDQLKQRDAVSYTPRTDAEQEIDNGDTKPLFEFCRQLERELAAVTADLEFRRALGALQQQEYDKVTAERDALKEEVIDWKQGSNAEAHAHDEARKDLSASQQETRRLREALEAIARRVPIMTSRGDYREGQMHALEACSQVANAALSSTPAPVHKDTELLDLLGNHAIEIHCTLGRVIEVGYDKPIRVAIAKLAKGGK